MKIIAAFTLAVIMGGALICPKAEGAEWYFYAEIPDEGIKLYYDAASIKYLPPDIVRVQTRELDLHAKGKFEIMQMRRESGLSTEGFEHYEYSMELWEIDCAGKKHKFLSVQYYDTKHNLLDSYYAPAGRWASIISGSAGEVLYEIACRLQGGGHHSQGGSFGR